MARHKVVYGNYFKVGQQVKLGVRLSENLLREASGEITSFEDDRARIELFGDIPGAFSSLKSNARLSLAGWSGWGFFNTTAILDEAVSGNDFIIRLTGGIEEVQRREYFRLDVGLPVVLTKPTEQTLAALTEQWQETIDSREDVRPPQLFSTLKGYRAVTADRLDIPPQAINLSGGGMRLRLPEKIAPGQRVFVDLYLPLAPARIVTVVAEVLRCNELALRIQKDPAYITALKFIQIDERDREAIIAYLFSEQRLLLQNEAEGRNLPTPR